MDEIVQKSIAEVERSKKTTVPWKVDEPYPQPFHRWNGNGWQAMMTRGRESNDLIPATIALYAWNIDFMLPFANSRMRIAMRHLESLIAKQEETRASVIHLNECLTSDIDLIKNDAWVRKTFDLTDVDDEFWQSGRYGTLTLVDRRLPIHGVFRVHYSLTRMERDGLFVDLDMGQAKPMRFCNTHLESLALTPPRRPSQLATCAKYLHHQAVHGGVVAGDFNAIQPFDDRLHSENGLKDAWLELGDKADNGHTWGQQAATVQRNRFGTCRMDKIFFVNVECLSFGIFGRGVCLDDEEERQKVVALGFDEPWITDHLGVMAVFRPSRLPSTSL